MSEENEEESGTGGTSRLIAMIGQVPAEGGGRLEVTISAWTSAKTGADAPKEGPAAIRVTRFTPSSGKKAVAGFRARACSSYKTAAESEGVATLLASAGPLLAKANTHGPIEPKAAEPKAAKGKT